MSTLSIYYFSGIDEEYLQSFLADRESGVRWLKVYESFDKIAEPKLVKAAAERNVERHTPGILPPFLNCCVISQIIEEVENACFQIIHSIEGEHPGYAIGANRTKRANIQVVVKKIN